RSSGRPLATHTSRIAATGRCSSRPTIRGRSGRPGARRTPTGGRSTAAMRQEFMCDRSLRRLARTVLVRLAEAQPLRPAFAKERTMAKSSKSSKTLRNERQKVVEQMRAQQKAAERRRGLTIVVVCSVVAVLIVGLAAFKPIKDWWDGREFRGKDVSQIGAPASVCVKPTTKPATGNQQHVQDGSPISYPDSPPAFGKHYFDPDPMARKFYTAADRPALGTLV